MKKFMLRVVGCLTACFAMAIVVGFVLAPIYVVCHFIAKFW